MGWFAAYTVYELGKLQMNDLHLSEYTVAQYDHDVPRVETIVSSQTRWWSITDMIILVQHKKQLNKNVFEQSCQDKN